MGLTLVVTTACVASAERDPDSELTADEAEAIASSVPAYAEVKVMLANTNFDPGTLGGARATREVTFYDTTELSLFRRGVVLRARRAPGSDDDSTVKIRPMTPSRVEKQFFSNDGFKCELDVVAGTAGMSSCSQTSNTDGSAIKAAALSSKKIDDLFGDEQRDFLRAAGVNVNFDSLRSLGPIASTVWKLEVRALDEEVTFERWDVPGGERTLEASIKVKTKNVRTKETELLAWLRARGLARATAQQTKTAAALAVLAR